MRRAFDTQLKTQCNVWMSTLFECLERYVVCAYPWKWVICTMHQAHPKLHEPNLVEIRTSKVIIYDRQCGLAQMTLSPQLGKG